MEDFFLTKEGDCCFSQVCSKCFFLQSDQFLPDAGVL